MGDFNIKRLIKFSKVILSYTAWPVIPRYFTMFLVFSFFAFFFVLFL